MGRLISFPPFESRMRMFSFKLLVIGLSVSGQIFGRYNLAPSLHRIGFFASWKLFLVFVMFASHAGVGVLKMSCVL